MPFFAPRWKNGERLGKEILKATVLPPENDLPCPFLFRLARQLLLDSRCKNGFESKCYLPFTNEQWVEAVFHVPESL